MGVHGLWKLIESAGKPVPVETLENKVLAVDVSIWLHQLMKGYQTPSGSSVSNAYLLGLFSRVCKLLFTNVKPVFVFDGGVPQLKKKTIAARQQQKSKSAQASEKLRQQLLKNLLKQKAVSQVLEEIRGQSSPKKKERDMFELPPLPDPEDSLSEVEEMSNSSSEEDVKPIKMKFKDLHTIDVKSAEFKDLPADMRHDILTELKETRKQNSWGRIHEMPEELGDFSKYQMSRLLKRRSVQVSLEEAEKEMGGRTLSLNDVEALLAEGGVEINPQLTKRIASDAVTRYIYVRETGEAPTSSQEAAVVAPPSKQEISFPADNSPDVKIKEEIIDLDELSDSELIKEVEAIEMAYVASNIKKEENEEFGTEEMFEEDTSSEGVIIDDMDLIKDTSGLSQEQILAIIKRENQNKTTLLNENTPSTSKGEFTSQGDLLKTNCSKETISVDNSVVLSKEKLSDLSETSKSNESKILDSLYFKMNKKRLISALTEKSKHIVNSDRSEIVSLNTTVPDTKADENEEKLVKCSALAPESDGSETEATHKLPCEVSLLELPKTTSKLVLKQSSLTDNDSNKAPMATSSKKLDDDATGSSSSESDGEFVEVFASTSSHDNQGLEIQIQTTQDQIHDDIFADIFSNKSSVQNEEITQSMKAKSITPCRDDEFSLAEKKENKQKSSVITSMKLLDRSKNLVNNEAGSVVISRQKENYQNLKDLQMSTIKENNKNPLSSQPQKQMITQSNVKVIKQDKNIQDLQKVKHTSQKNTKSIPDFQRKTIQEISETTQRSPLKKQMHTQVNNKCVLDAQIPSSLESKRDNKPVQIQQTPYQGNRKYRQSLYTLKQGSHMNVQSSQISNPIIKPKTAKEIFSSIFEDYDSDKETVDETENISKNEECYENEEFDNQMEMETDSESSFESVKNESERTPSPKSRVLTSILEDSIHKESVTLDKSPSIPETNTIDPKNLVTVNENPLIPKPNNAVSKPKTNIVTAKNLVTLDKTPFILESNTTVLKPKTNIVAAKHFVTSDKNPFNLETNTAAVTIPKTNTVATKNLVTLNKPPLPLEPNTAVTIPKTNTEDAENSVTLDKSAVISESNSAVKEKLSSPLIATEESEVQSNVQQSLEDSEEEVDDPGQVDNSDNPPLSEDGGPSKKPKRILDLRQLQKLQDILETKERELVVDQNREDRLATTLTDQMYQEAQELLRLFGVPFIVAPMEAEAQCAFLDASGLTEGTITDDSDIWLFGGRKVYKNFFDQKKFVLEFQSNDIQQYFKLSRSHLVLLALLVGSDYTVGLSGVGPVTALEILSTFPPARSDSRDTHELLVSLTQFREWCCAQPNTHATLAKKLRNVDIHEGFPSAAVVSAYLNPLVDDSREAFSWGTPDVAALRDYAESKFGWSRSRTDQILMPAVNKLSQRTSQLTLHTFFGAIPNISAHREQMSRRVQSAVNRLDGGSEEFTPLEPRPRQSRGRGASRGRGRAATTLGEELPFPGAVAKAPEVIPQREKDRMEASKRKQQAIEVLKSKKPKGMKKRRNVRQIKPEANLSESSSDEN